MQRFLKTLALIGGALAIPGTVLLFMQWLERPRSTLEATVEFGRQVLPPDVLAIVSAWPRLVSEETIGNAIDSLDLWQSVPRNERAFIPFALSGWINRRLADRIPELRLHDLADAGAYWRIQLRNAGNQALSHIRVQIPLVRQTCTLGHDQVCTNGDVPLSLETLQPLEEVTVVAWTGSLAGEWQFDEIHITHSAGIADLRQKVPVGRLWIWLSRNWYVPFALLLWIGLTVIVSIIGQIEHRQFRPDTRGGETGTASDAG